MPAGQTAQIFFDSNIIKVTANLNNIEWTTSGETKSGVIGSNFTVSLNSGYIIDTIVCQNCTLGTQQDTTFTMIDLATTETSIITITSKQSTPTLTFKHFFDAGLQGTGTYKFRHYSQSEPKPQGYQVTVTNSDPNNHDVEDISIYESNNIVTPGGGAGYGTLLGKVTANQTITVTVTKKYIYVYNTKSGVDTYSAELSKVALQNTTGIGIDCFEVLGNGTITATGYYCLTGDTLITLANGTQKRIDELTVQDRVLAINPETKAFVSDEITYTDSTEHKTFTEYDVWTFSDGTIVKTVHRHRFYNVEKQAMVYMDEWNVGDHAVNQNGERIALVSHENVKEEVKHYTIFTKHQNYFANGLLSGNRYTEKCVYFD